MTHTESQDLTYFMEKLKPYVADAGMKTFRQLELLMDAQKIYHCAHVPSQ